MNNTSYHYPHFIEEKTGAHNDHKIHPKLVKYWANIWLPTFSYAHGLSFKPADHTLSLSKGRNRGPGPASLWLIYSHKLALQARPELRLLFFGSHAALWALCLVLLAWVLTICLPSGTLPDSSSAFSRLKCKDWPTWLAPVARGFRQHKIFTSDDTGMIRVSSDSWAIPHWGP